MKFTELQKKTKTELEKLCQDLRERLRALRFNLSTGKVKNVKEVRQVRKEIAQILTLLRETSSKKK